MSRLTNPITDLPTHFDAYEVHGSRPVGQVDGVPDTSNRTHRLRFSVLLAASVTPTFW